MDGGGGGAGGQQNPPGPSRFRFDSFQPGRERWATYEMRLTIALDAQGFRSDNERKSALLQVCNSEVFEALLGQLYPRTPDSGEVTFDTVKLALAARYGGHTSTLVGAETEFLNRMQQPNESLTEYLSELRRLARQGEFPQSAMAGRLKTQLVRGCGDERAREKLLRKSDNYSLEKVVEVIAGFERARGTMQSVAPSQSPWTMVNTAQLYNPYFPTASFPHMGPAGEEHMTDPGQWSVPPDPEQAADAEVATYHIDQAQGSAEGEEDLDFLFYMEASRQDEGDAAVLCSDLLNEDGFH
ncbi:putative feruloyl esterase C [Frankliniella fusca]|uniref:Feruloyl esterase C n=1 Tax=Frankliniella fusca TaxID=407009 RepID=A0AAE1I5M3_9NEOP|nr:putative feruloyl esterase C [Frankliniella fusca]